jgi:hypothetical protein
MTQPRAYGSQPQGLRYRSILMGRRPAVSSEVNKSNWATEVGNRLVPANEGGLIFRREPINSDGSAYVSFEAHFGLESDITASEAKCTQRR